MDRTVTMDKVVNLCKRRGLIFASSEIYGGLGSCWDYGPLGAELKRNVRDAWWQAIVRERTDVVGLDSAILMHPRVWEASGHVEGFTDPLVDCRQCKERFRTDELPTLLRCTACEGQVRTGADEAALRVLEKQQGPQARTAAEEAPLADESDRCAHCGRTATLVSAMSWCPRCGSGDLTDARQFNLMFKTFLGAVEDSAHVAYLRPETAQGIFVNFLNVLNAARQKIPFGIAQIGKSFRNEITPGNFVFRTREFEQMEIEYFVSPGTDEQWFEYWSGERLRWYRDLGIRPEHLRVRPHGPEELAHYAKACVDIEYRFPFGWAELEGIANRTDFDLRRHAEYSGRDLTYFDEETRERYIPYVIEPSGGVDRTVLAFLVDAYDEDAVEGETRTVLRLHPRLAPVKAAVLPLLRKDGHPERAREIFDRLRRRLAAAYDQAGSIGRRYRRQDEIGTPFGITVDHQTLADGTVTLRERDSTQQIRIPADDVVAELQRRIDET